MFLNLFIPGEDVNMCQGPFVFLSLSFPCAQRTGLGRTDPDRQLCPACVLDHSLPFHFWVHFSAKCFLWEFSESPQPARE